MELDLFKPQENPAPTPESVLGTEIRNHIYLTYHDRMGFKRKLDVSNPDSVRQHGYRPAYYETQARMTKKTAEDLARNELQFPELEKLTLKQVKEAAEIMRAMAISDVGRMTGDFIDFEKATPVELKEKSGYA